MSNNSFDLENYLYFAIGLKDNDYETRIRCVPNNDGASTINWHNLDIFVDYAKI